MVEVQILIIDPVLVIRNTRRVRYAENSLSINPGAAMTMPSSSTTT